jgi:carbamoyl-phosphate synthase large subunit
MADSQQIAVMVTGVGGGGLGEQIIKALRLASRPYTIVGGDMNRHSCGLNEVDHPYVLPPASDPVYLDAVLAVCRRYNVRILFPGSEVELEAISQNRSCFDEQGIILPINPPQVIETCLDKARTMAFLDEHGFAYPKYQEVASLQDLAEIDFLPAVLKPVVGGGGSANIFLAQTKSELELFGRHLLDLVPRFICQEYVGLPEDEYTVGVLLDLEGNLINSIAVRRQILSGLSNRLKAMNRTGREELGPVLAVSSGVSQGEIGPFPQVTGPCEKLALALGCTSAVNIQCRLVSGTPYVFEINPRFSGTTSLRALVGYNEPDLLIRRHVLGEQVAPGFSYTTGFIARGLKESLLGDMGIPRAGDML